MKLVTGALRITTCQDLVEHHIGFFDVFATFKPAKKRGDLLWRLNLCQNALIDRNRDVLPVNAASDGDQRVAGVLIGL